jgi:hypothetical protein
MTKFYSRILKEHGEISDDGTVTFESGVVYTKPEIEVLRNIPADDIKGIHRLRMLFGGELVYCGKTDVLPVHPVKNIVSALEQLALTLESIANDLVDKKSIKNDAVEQLSLF